MADEAKFAKGGKLTLGSKVYTLGERSSIGAHGLRGNGEFDDEYLEEGQVAELIEAGATYEAPAAAESSDATAEATS